MRRSVALAIVLGPMAWGLAAEATRGAPPMDASLADLRAEAADNDLVVSFQVLYALTPELRERIAAGLPVTFTHYLEVSRHRLLWFDRTLARKTVTTTVTYDTLTRQYKLTKEINDEVAETSVAVSEADMMRWMTDLDRVRLADASILEGADDDSLYIRVKSRIQKKFVLLFIPWSVDTGWQRVSVHIPGEPPGLGR